MVADTSCVAVPESTLAYVHYPLCVAHVPHAQLRAWALWPLVCASQVVGLDAHVGAHVGSVAGQEALDAQLAQPAALSLAMTMAISSLGAFLPRERNFFFEN